MLAPLFPHLWGRGEDEEVKRKSGKESETTSNRSEVMFQVGHGHVHLAADDAGGPGSGGQELGWRTQLRGA